MAKGQLESAFILIEIIVLVLGLVSLVYFIQLFWRPHEQIAIANAAALQATINQVCTDGRAKQLQFKFPQPLPAYLDLGVTAVGQNIIPKFMTRTKGDPNFLLYYEAFPVAEGIRWEAYLDFPSWALIPIYKPDQTIANADEFLKNEATLWKERAGVEEVVFPNVILGEGPLTGNVGNFTGNNYKFSTFASLSPFKKTLVKYRTCGSNALCFKTKNGIIRLPLDSCAAAGIDYIQLETVRAGGLILPEAVIPDEFFRSDFYVASPCEAELFIQRTKCECRDSLDFVTDTLAGTEYPIWEYRNGQLVRVAQERLHCWHRASGVADKTTPHTEQNCLEINLLPSSGACRAVPPGTTVTFEEADEKYPLLSYAQDRTRPDGTHYAIHQASAKDAIDPGLFSGGWAWPSGVS